MFKIAELAKENYLQAKMCHISGRGTMGRPMVPRPMVPRPMVPRLYWYFKNADMISVHQSVVSNGITNVVEYISYLLCIQTIQYIV